jgi:hypothetical protein
MQLAQLMDCEKGQLTHPGYALTWKSVNTNVGVASAQEWEVLSLPLAILTDETIAQASFGTVVLVF